MWPSYKPISWDKYYAHTFDNKNTSMTSGLAAGITIGVFLTVFLLTFGCRLYSKRSESTRQSSLESMSGRRRRQRRLSVTDLYMLMLGNRCLPPPPYEIAIQMPKPIPSISQAYESPPSFNEIEATNAPVQLQLQQQQQLTSENIVLSNKPLAEISDSDLPESSTVIAAQNTNNTST